MLNRSLAVFLLVLSCSLGCLAQSNEISASIGTTYVSDQKGTTFSINTSHGLSFEGNLAHRLFGLGPAAGLYVELPVIAVTNQDVKTVTTSNVVTSAEHASNIFITPSLKLKLLPGLPIVPFVSVGGGLAHYSIHGSPTVNRGAVQFGGGVDVKTPIPFLALRGEVRDIYTSSNINSLLTTTLLTTSHVHNVFAAAGLVLHF